MKRKSNYYDESEMAIVYVVMSRLMKQAKDTDAYALGLIDSKYKLLREPDPDNIEEMRALSPLNIFIFKLKRALGTRIISIFKHIYLNNFDDDAIIDKLAIKGNIKSRGEIIKLKKNMLNSSNLNKLR
jgi:hypothetical protein